MVPALINFVATLFSPPNCSFDLSVTHSVTNVARRGAFSLTNTNQAILNKFLNFSTIISAQPLFCEPTLTLFSPFLSLSPPFFFPPLDLQIIKVSTTAQEGIMTSFLRGLRHHRPRPQLISPSCPPQAPLAPPSEVWTTPCRATTLPVKCNVSLTSCPTTRGTLPARSPASRGPCTASPPRCSAPTRPLPHCHWTAAATATTCPTHPRKWTRALCGSFQGERTLTGKRFSDRGRWGLVAVMGAWNYKQGHGYQQG